MSRRPTIPNTHDFQYFFLQNCTQNDAFYTKLCMILLVQLTIVCFGDNLQCAATYYLSVANKNEMKIIHKKDIYNI